MNVKKLMNFLGLVVVANAASATTLPATWTMNAGEKDTVVSVGFQVEEPRIVDASVNILSYGAMGDGQTLCTEAINRAISDMAGRGGGRVIIPSGLWLTGPIEMRSGIDLHAETGALVIFTTDHSQFPLQKDGRRTVSCIYGDSLQDIAFTGDGVYDGGGDTWRPSRRFQYADMEWEDMKRQGYHNLGDSVLWPSQVDYKKGDFRNNLCTLHDCKRVLFDGPTFQNSPRFTVVPHNCEDLTIRNIHVLNEDNAQNGDGIDLSGGNRILVEDCVLSVGDDGICMKSSALGRTNLPILKNVYVRNCKVYHAHGGFVVGSNTDGGMQHIFVENCSFMATFIGLRFKSNRGRGGDVSDIYIRNIHMRNILNQAILLDSHYGMLGVGEKPRVGKKGEKVPDFHHIYMSHIYCNGANQAIKIDGQPEGPVRDLYLYDVKISAEQGISEQNAVRIHKTDVHVSLTGDAKEKQSLLRF